MANVRSGQLILAAIFAIFVYGMVAAMLGTILPSFQFTPDQAGTVAMAQALGLVLASLSAGPLVDNKGKKPVLVVSLGLIALSLFLLANATAPGVGEVGTYLFILGFGGGMLVTSANTLVSDIGEDRRAATLNFLNLFFGLGGLATPFVAANLLGGDAVRIALTAAILTAAVFLFHAITPMPGPTGERGFKSAEVGQLLGSPTLWLLSLFLFLYVACEVGVWNWLAKYLISRGVPEQNALNILSLGFALGMLIGRVVVSRILIRVAAPTVTLAASVLMAATTYLMLQTSDPTIAGIAVFCAGLAMAPVFPTTLAMVGDAFPVATATAMGIVITCGWIGLAISSPIIGRIAGGDDTRLGTALLLLPALSVAMILVNLALRPMLSRRA